MYLSRYAQLAFVFAPQALAQFVVPPSNQTFTIVEGPLGIRIRYKEVKTGPGSICEHNPSVKSYSGYVDVSEHQHVFFWLFGARDRQPNDAHLTAWISGGPGDSSMSELFTEHGPCRIDEDLNVENNPNSWNTGSNMIYIDQPITVGFSYSDAVPAMIDENSGNCELVKLKDAKCPASAGSTNDNCDQYGPDSVCGTFPDPTKAQYTANSTENAAPTFYLALQGIYAAFPDFTRHGFSLGSESYGGHYAPVFSRYIAQQNAKLPYGAATISQTSLLVGNGWYDPAVGYAAFYDFVGSPGNTYDIKLSKTSADKMHAQLYGSDKCLDQLAVCNSVNGTDKNCRSADDFCTNHVQNIYDNNATSRDEYDIRELDPSPFIPEWYVEYLNTGPVQKELGVFTNYTDESVLVGNTFESTGDDGRELGITQALTDLLDSGLGVTLYHGDSDYNCNWYGGQKVAQRIAELSKTAGLTSAYASAGFQNVTTPDNIVHGQVKQAGLFSFVRVYQAGHQVGFFQPVLAQAIYERTSAGLDIATGKVNVSYTDGILYKSIGPSNSTYREGNSTVQYVLLPPETTYNTTTNAPNKASE